MGVLNHNVLAGASGQGSSGFEISRSLRFNKEDSAYLGRTFGSGNQRKWTFSCWVKRNKVTTSYDTILSSSTDPIALDGTNLYFLGDQLYFDAFSTTSLTFRLKTFPRFRDYSAWYHIVAVFDSDNSTEDDRAILYVNGVRIPQGDLATNTKPASGLSPNFNNAKVHAIGKRGSYSAVNDTDYNSANITLAETYFVDGQALAASDFGKTDDNGVWQPKEEVTVPTSINDGTIWSNSTDSALGNYHGVTGIFDNSLSTRGGDTNTAYLTYVDNATITASTGIRVYWNGIGAGQRYIRINGTTEIDNGSSGMVGWSPLSSYSGTINKIEIKTANTGSFGISAIEIDGEILIDNYNNSTGYGTNGFHLKFDDNSSTSALGTDSSGNNNDFTVNNLSVTAGAGNDSLLDSPTNNFATLNPIHVGANVTLSDGNLKSTVTSSWNTVSSTIAPSSGKWQCEFTIDTASTNYGFGVGNPTTQKTGSYMGQTADSWVWFPKSNSGLFVNGAYVNQAAPWGSASGTFPGVGDVVGMALDLDNGTLKYYIDGSLVGTAFTNITGPVSFCDCSYGGVNIFNFGQRPFAHPVTGYKALCTANLDNPTIEDPSKHFDINLWNGNDATSRAITGFSFSPDFLWIKSRNAAGWHVLADSVRGAGKILASNATNSEYNNSDSQTAIQSFDSNGFTIGHQSGWVVNSNSTTIAGWAWKAGTGSAVDNTDGSITSQVLANPSAGFSIVSVTAAAHADGSTVGHGLNAKPAMIIEKNRDGSSAWYTQHSGLGDMSGSYLKLNLTSAKATDNTWNLAEPTTSVISHDPAYIYGSTTADVIYYCFTPVEGYSSFGTYTGNGDDDGPFVYTGFRTRWLLVKSSSSTSPWTLLDADRSGPLNPANDVISADSNSAEVEYSSAYHFDLLSNGFKVRSSTTDVNTSTHTYVYAAFAEHPFKNARAR